MPKPASQRRRRNSSPRSTTKAPDAVSPNPPETFLEATKDAWRTYWGSELASLALGVDRASVDRLFGMYDQHARAMEVVRQALVVRGSTGQIRVNPLAEHALKLEGAIVRLENELGLTPAARVRLGIQLKGRKAQEDEPEVDYYAHLRIVQ